MLGTPPYCRPMTTFRQSCWASRPCWRINTKSGFKDLQSHISSTVYAVWNCAFFYFIYPLMGTGNYSATSNNMKLVHWPLIGGMLHFVQRWGPLLALPNVTAHPSTASVPITVLLYSGMLLCGFNAPIKGLNRRLLQQVSLTVFWRLAKDIFTFYWTNISLYLGNDTRYGHSYYGLWIGTRMRSIEWCHFQWPWVTSNPHFKITPLFDAEYLRNGTNYIVQFT